jgi:hypothetical protein
MLLLPCAPTRAAETNIASRSCNVVGAGSLEIHRPATSAAQTRREERRLGLCSMLPPLLHRWLELSRTADGRRCRVLSRLQLCAQTLRALGTPRSRAGRRIMRWSAQAKRRAQARRSHAHQRRGPCLQHAHLVPLLAYRTSPAIVVVASGAVARAAQRAAVECITTASAVRSSANTSMPLQRKLRSCRAISPCREASLSLLIALMPRLARVGCCARDGRRAARRLPRSKACTRSRPPSEEGGSEPQVSMHGRAPRGCSSRTASEAASEQRGAA